MNKKNVLIYISNLISNYTFMCKNNTQINQDIQKINKCINEFKNDNLTNSDLFLNTIINLSYKNYDILFNEQLLDNINTLRITNNFNSYATLLQPTILDNIEFKTIPIIQIPEQDSTKYTHDVIIHDNYLNQFSPQLITEIQSNSEKLKDFYLERLSSINQAVEIFNSEFAIDFFKDNPPTVILSYKKMENLEYNAALYNQANKNTSLIDLALPEEAVGTFSHELLHLLEYEYTKLKYANHRGRLISNIYYNRDLESKKHLENQDVFLIKLKTFDNLTSVTTPISQQDRLNILEDFLKEHLKGKDLSKQQYSAVNSTQQYQLVNAVINSINPNSKNKIATILDFKNQLDDYISGKSNFSFFHIESSFYDKLRNKKYFDKYSEKLARLAGLYVDKDYQSKPLPRGNEKQIYQEKFTDIVCLLRDEVNKLKKQQSHPNTINPSKIVLNFEKKTIMDKLKNNRITSAEKTHINNYKM